MTLRNILLASVGAMFLSACGDRSVSTSTPTSTPKPTLTSAGTDAAVAAAPSALTIDYEKFTLDNGLDVILQVDRSDPILSLIHI